MLAAYGPGRSRERPWILFANTREAGGDVAGTPLSMAPEAFTGRLSEKLDVYRLAALLACLLTGSPLPRPDDH